MIFKYIFLFIGIIIGIKAAEEDVVELGDGSFKSEISQYDHTLVMFYAPWCGHCKHLKPEFAKAAETLKYDETPVTLAKVDCTEAGKETCSEFGVSGYPTLKIFRKGELFSEYKGPRESAGIIKYMRGQVGPSSKILVDESSEKEFFDKNNVNSVVVVGYFEKDSSDFAKVFDKVSSKLKEKVRFAHSYAKTLLKKDGGEERIVLFRPKLLENKFEDSKLVYKDDANADKIEKFITSNYYGLVGVRDRENTDEFKNPLIVAYYAVDYVKNPKGTNYWRNRIMKVAKEFSKLKFAISNKDDFQHELNDFGIDFVKGEKPVVLARNAAGQKFVMKDEFSIDTFKTFLEDFLADKLEPFLKSEPVPEDNSGPVKVAVAKNFDELVNQADKDVLIEFYAPWCGYCKKLAPIYDELGAKMADEDVLIVKMDVTANDAPPQFQVQGFPTLYWIPKNQKDSPVKYEGGRELNDFVKYIAEHATDKLKGFDRKGNSVKLSDEL